MCDRVIFIQHGKIVAEDTPKNLAKTITDCHLLLHIQGYTVSIPIEENRIAVALKTLAHAGIEYEQIEIEKPTLEDYFIARSGEKSV